MTEQDAVVELNALVGADAEGDHHEADKILLAVVPEAVRAAWEAARDRADGFYYA